MALWVCRHWNLAVITVDGLVGIGAVGNCALFEHYGEQGHQSIGLSWNFIPRKGTAKI